MALRYREIALNLNEDESCLKSKLASRLGLAEELIQDFKIVRKSVDARKKTNILRVYSVEFVLKDEQSLLLKHAADKRLERIASVATDKPAVISRGIKVVVVGMGPAGLFCALKLSQAGAQVTLLEMGEAVEERIRKVEDFWNKAELSPSSNVQFGEGGAGTFSDGKLSTRVNHPAIREVLETLVRFGADEDILKQAKPHVGTDRLRKVLINFRKHLVSLGVSIHYRHEVTSLVMSSGQVRGVVCNGTSEFPGEVVVLAPGHSATRTFSFLHASGVKMEPKPFAMGVRVDHPVELINTIQYGMPTHRHLPVADYALTYNDAQSGRGVYSFCMCPGGEVINASSEPGGVVVNGMSRRLRDGSRSNSALVVTVRANDYYRSSPLDGLFFQREWERKAFEAAGSSYSVPAQNLLGFYSGGKSKMTACCPPGVKEVPLDTVLPRFVAEGIRKALPHFERRMRGFVTGEANLYGVETRTSSPVRILRDEYGESISHPGLFPTGEGAGYAGGIMSAALDGMKIAGLVSKRRVRSRL